MNWAKLSAIKVSLRVRAIDLFDSLWPFVFLLIKFQRFSMGFRSGYWAGHARVLIWWSLSPHLDCPGYVAWSIVLLGKKKNNLQSSGTL